MGDVCVALVTDILKKENQVLKDLVLLGLYIVIVVAFTTHKLEIETACTSTSIRYRQAASVFREFLRLHYFQDDWLDPDFLYRVCGTEIDIAWPTVVDILVSPVILKTLRGEFSKRLLQMVSTLVKKTMRLHNSVDTLEAVKEMFRRACGNRRTRKLLRNSLPFPVLRPLLV